MATDIDPKRDSRQLENENFATNSNNKTVRRVEDESAIGVLEQILAELGGSAGTPVFYDTQTVTTPGVTQTLVNETVGVGKTLTIRKVRVTCRQRTTYNILLDSTIIGSGRVGAGEYNDDFVFVVNRTLSAGSVLKVETLSGGKATDIEVYVQALEN